MTALATVKDGVKPSDFRRPGHMFPLEARAGGVLKRAGHTEATVDLCRLAGLKEVGLCCEIMKDDGTMARLDDVVAFSKKHGLKMMTIADLMFLFSIDLASVVARKLFDVDLLGDWPEARALLKLLGENPHVQQIEADKKAEMQAFIAAMAGKAK